MLSVNMIVLVFLISICYMKGSLKNLDLVRNIRISMFRILTLLIVVKCAIGFRKNPTACVKRPLLQ